MTGRILRKRLGARISNAPVDSKRGFSIWQGASVVVGEYRRLGALAEGSGSEYLLGADGNTQKRRSVGAAALCRAPTVFHLGLCAARRNVPAALF